MELQKKNFERLVNQRERMNHTTVDGFYYNHNKQVAVDLRKSFERANATPEILEGKVINK